MYKSYIKRIIDLLLALIAILILTPFMIPIVIGLLLTGEHYVFYFQERIGYKNKPFKIWKFATMLRASPKLGTGSLTLRNDPRLMPMGRFLRKTKINEIPQVINVLLGSMSVVGPRPLMAVDFKKFPEAIRDKVYQSRPGITGIGSIIFRDEEKWISESGMDPHEFDKKFIAPYKGALEIWYQENISFVTDVKLVICTVWVILFPHSELPYRFFNELPAKPVELTE
ncbi:MAG: sugar transferase [Bacteroidales bacterium]|nr:sugar transferase [Bacteroidales bacterium]